MVGHQLVGWCTASCQADGWFGVKGLACCRALGMSVLGFVSVFGAASSWGRRLGALSGSLSLPILARGILGISAHGLVPGSRGVAASPSSRGGALGVSSCAGSGVGVLAGCWRHGGRLVLSFFGSAWRTWQLGQFGTCLASSASSLGNPAASSASRAWAVLAWAS
jgi:hypothetical protein